MKFGLLLMVLLFSPPVARADDDSIECFNHPVRYEFFRNEDGYFFRRLGPGNKSEEVGAFPTSMAANDAAAKDCEELPPEEPSSAIPEASPDQDEPEVPGPGEIDQIPGPRMSGYSEELPL